MIEFLDNYTVIDIETTGLSPTKNEIIELSGLKIRDNKIIREFSTLVRPNNKVNSFISNLTGISNTMLDDAPQITDVLLNFKDFMDNDTILGHNVSFDMNFIKNKLAEHYNLELINKTNDTMHIARQTLKLKSYKLSNIAQYYNIDTQNNHRGLKDCYITFEVYNKLREENLLSNNTVK